MGGQRRWVHDDPPRSDQGTLLKGLGIGCSIAFALFLSSFLAWPVFFAPPIVVAVVTKRYQDSGETRTAKGIFVSVFVSYCIVLLLGVLLFANMEIDD